MNNKYIIIFEGLDGTGKTTIAKALAEKLNLQYFKNSMHGLDSMPEKYKDRAYFDNLLKYQAPLTLAFLRQCLFKEKGIILDRFIPSEFAYGMALRNGTDEDLIWQIDKKLFLLGAKVIYLTKCFNRVTQPKEFMYSELVKIRTYYQIYKSTTLMPWLWLDTTSENLSYQITEIVHFLSSSS